MRARGTPPDHGSIHATCVHGTHLQKGSTRYTTCEIRILNVTSCFTEPRGVRAPTEGSGTSGTLHNRAWHNTTCKVQVHLLIASHENNTCTHTRAKYTRARNAHARATHTRATHTHACTGAYTLTRAYSYTHARAHTYTNARALTLESGRHQPPTLGSGCIALRSISCAARQ